MNVHYDADLSIILSKKVAVIGYGSQDHAHALNLSESGVSVAVGLRPGSSSIAQAIDKGLKVMTVEEAARYWRLKPKRIKARYC